MKKQEMERLWEELSGGAEGIYQRYEQAKALRSQEAQQQKKQAKEAYDREQGRLSVAAKIRDQNTKAVLADQGLSRSGESLHAGLMNDYLHSRSADEAARQYSDAVKEMDLAQSKADAESEAEMAKEMSALHQALYSLGLEEKKLAQEGEQFLRELEQKEKQSIRETEQKEKQSIRETEQKDNQFRQQLEQDRIQWEGENDLEKEKLEEDKRQFDEGQEALAQEEREQYEEEIRELEGRLEKKDDGGMLPDKTPKTLYKDLLYTAEMKFADMGNYDPAAYEKKVADYMRSNLLRLIEDEDLDVNYRKTLAIYGMLAGYLLEEDDDGLGEDEEE